MVKGAIAPNVICSLYEEDSGAFIERKNSDASGAYRFDNLDVNLKFFIIVKKPFGLWEYRVQYRITPVL